MRTARASRLFSSSINHKIESWCCSCHSCSRCQSNRSVSTPEGYKLSKHAFLPFENNVQHKLSVENQWSNCHWLMSACLIACFVESHVLFSFFCWRNQAHCTSVEPFGARALTDSDLHARFLSLYEADLEKEWEASIDDGARWPKDDQIRTESKLFRAPSRRHLMLLPCCYIILLGTLSRHRRRQRWRHSKTQVHISIFDTKELFQVVLNIRWEVTV